MCVDVNACDISVKMISWTLTSSTKHGRRYRTCPGCRDHLLLMLYAKWLRLLHELGTGMLRVPANHTP